MHGQHNAGTGHGHGTPGILAIVIGTGAHMAGRRTTVAWTITPKHRRGTTAAMSSIHVFKRGGNGEISCSTCMCCSGKAKAWKAVFCIVLCVAELPCSLPMLHLICLHASMHKTRKRLQRHGRGGAHVRATRPWPTSFNAFPRKDAREHAAAEYMGVAWLCCGVPTRETT